MSNKYRLLQTKRKYVALALGVSAIIVVILLIRNLFSPIEFTTSLLPSSIHISRSEDQSYSALTLLVARLTDRGTYEILSNVRSVHYSYATYDENVSSLGQDLRQSRFGGAFRECKPFDTNHFDFIDKDGLVNVHILVLDRQYNNCSLLIQSFKYRSPNQLELASAKVFQSTHHPLFK